MRELSDVVRRHRGRLVDEVATHLGDAASTAELERLFDDLADLMAGGTPGSLRELLETVATRGLAGEFTYGRFLRALHLAITPALRKVVAEEGAESGPVDSLLTRFATIAAEAYAASYLTRLGELERQRLTCEAEAARLRALSHLVMGVAHELNTPLEVINQACELAARDGNDDMREAVRLIRHNVTRAGELIRRFRGLSVSEIADQIQLVDVAGAVTDAIAMYRASTLEPKLQIIVVDRLDGAADGAGPWQGHRLYFTHVLVNLLANAEHHAYRDAGGLVEIVLARRDNRLLVTVSDQGVGIADGDVERVVSPFFTTGGSPGRGGLGLAVVHNLVTAGMRGTLRIESEAGAGTRVLLEFPWRTCLAACPQPASTV